MILPILTQAVYPNNHAIIIKLSHKKEQNQNKLYFPNKIKFLHPLAKTEQIMYIRIMIDIAQRLDTAPRHSNNGDR